MSVTAGQRAQAEADRQRQADVVQTLVNEVRRLGTEQNNNLQEIQRLRAEHFLPTPPVDPLDAGGQPPQATPAGRGITDTRTRGVTGVSSCVRTCQWFTSNSVE